MKITTILSIVGIAVLAFAVGTSATTVSNVIMPAAQAEKKSSSSGSSSSGGSVPLTAIKNRRYNPR
jgi:hypothetical protein